MNGSTTRKTTNLSWTRPTMVKAPSWTRVENHSLRRLWAKRSRESAAMIEAKVVTTITRPQPAISSASKSRSGSTTRIENKHTPNASNHPPTTATAVPHQKAFPRPATSEVEIQISAAITDHVRHEDFRPAVASGSCSRSTDHPPFRAVLLPEPRDCTLPDHPSTLTTSQPRPSRNLQTISAVPLGRLVPELGAWRQPSRR